MTEWDLLKAARGIEQGDYVWVEKEFGGHREKMVIVSEDEDDLILKDDNGKEFIFNPCSMCEKKGKLFIIDSVE